MRRYSPGSGAPARTPAVVGEVLREYGNATRTVVEQYLAGEPRHPYLYELLADYPRRGGKMMRPSICVAHARAFGGDLEEAVLTAATIEIMHNALLIHDDIEDASEMRRGKPALHVLHGMPLALNAGDMLMLLSLRPLLDSAARIGERLTLEILRETELMARETAEGQSLELGWRDRNCTDLGAADYFKMVLKKTAWFGTIYPARVGSLIGSIGAIDPAIFNRFGFFLGAAFQIQDDLLNLVGDPSYGKERDGDLFEGKRTLMLIHAYQCGATAEKAAFAKILALPRRSRTQQHVDWLRGAIERHGSIDYARTVAQGLAGAALHEFSIVYDALPPTRDKEFIAGLITWVFERS